MADFPQLTPAELAVELGKLLVAGSLYKRFVYDSTNCHYTAHEGMTRPRYGRLPSLVKMYCDGEHCRQETLWVKTGKAERYFWSGALHDVEYRCRNCGLNTAHYSFLWTENPTTHESVFMKVGQFPALSIEPPADLARALGKEDTALYKKALINGSYSFGIGALAYFRRVIENKVNMLLDLIGEAAKLANFESEELARIEEIKSSHHVDVKIEYASKILPPHLRPGGHNPMNKLYGVASTGIHGKSDEECLQDFQDARFEFEYLFRNLTVSNEDARAARA